jgi:2-polyprenyl-3-methyl-5-hydroxy-6-metoxy-1,4-benzoquinol methylase
MIFLSPIPADLGSYYTQAYPAYQRPTLQELEAKAEQERYKLDIVQNHVTRGRLLEIGPSFGGFAYLAKKAGFEVEAIEMDAECCRYLTEVVGVTAINTGRASQALEDRKPYQVAALWHVIEHLADPWETLEAVSKKLQPGGFLVIAAPNPASLQFRIFGPYWIHVDAPRHLQLIPAELIARHMESFGMKTVLTTTKDRAGTQFHSFGWWAGSFRIVMKGLRPGRLEKQAGSRRQGAVSREAVRTSALPEMPGGFINLLTFPLRVTKIAFAVGVRLLAFLMMKPFERREGLGSAYTIVLQKKQD